MLAATDGKLKYVYSEANAMEEMYDQVNDPGELDNLTNNSGYENKKREMRNLLRQYAAKFDDMDLLDGDDFAKRDVERSKLSSAPVGGMGWRWY